MKFSCGKTKQQKLKDLYAQGEDKMIWRPWFAWYPVSVGDVDGTKKCVWLETVERRYTFYVSRTFVEISYSAEYREIIK